MRIALHAASADVIAKLNVDAERTALEDAGFESVGTFEVFGMRDVAVMLFLRNDGAVGEIGCGKQITVSVSTEYPDGSHFQVKNTAAAPGITAPPWVAVEQKVGACVPELIGFFDAVRPAGSSVEWPRR